MSPYDACRILHLSGTFSLDELKKAFRRQSNTYHPDKGGSEEMQKLINLAYEVLKEFIEKEPEVNFDFSSDKHNQDYPKEFNAAYNAIKNLKNITIEITGVWMWISGETKQYKELFKQYKFRFSGPKKCWYFRPENYKSKNRKTKSMSYIRDKYGSKIIRPENKASSTPCLTC